MENFQFEIENKNNIIPLPYKHNTTTSTSNIYSENKIKSLLFHAEKTENFRNSVNTWRNTQIERGSCPKCYNSRTYILDTCICPSFRTLYGCPHAVTSLIHVSELRKTTSTHVLFKRGLENADVCIWRSNNFLTSTDVWNHVVNECKISKRTPVLLFPSKNAIPAIDFVNALSPQQRKHGLHVIVPDGTWHNVSAMVTEFPSYVTKLVVSPPPSYTIFGPCRGPPAPGRISTLEAVACLFDEFRLACRGLKNYTKRHFNVLNDSKYSLRVSMKTSENAKTLTNDNIEKQEMHTQIDELASRNFVQEKRIESIHVSKKKSTEIPIANSIIADISGKKDISFDSDECSTDIIVPTGFENIQKSTEKHVLEVEFTVQPATVYGEDFWATKMRLLLMMHVDSMNVGLHKLDPNILGVGYRTWRLTCRSWKIPSNYLESEDNIIKPVEGDLRLLAGPYLSRIPCYLLTYIATLAYGDDYVLQDGYDKSFVFDVGRWGKILNPRPFFTSYMDEPNNKRSLATTNVEESNEPDANIFKHADSDMSVKERKMIRLSMKLEGKKTLPSCLAKYRTPLAMTCRAMYILSAGYFYGSWNEC
jgi:DTW domain-containing protein YfiP